MTGQTCADTGGLTMPDYTPTDADIAYARRLVGTGDPDDNALWDAIADAGSAALASKYILEVRLADLLASPAQFSVTGYSENNTANITALKEKLASLETVIEEEQGSASTTTITTVDLYRPGRCGRR